MKIRKIFIGILFIISLFLLYRVSLVNKKYYYTYNYNDTFLDGAYYFRVNTYKKDDTKKVIYRIPVGTTVSELLAKIETDGNKVVVDSNGIEIPSNMYVASGCMIKALYSEAGHDYVYKLSVIGDVLGEGDISQYGAKMLGTHLINGTALSGDEFLLAGDMNDDGSLKINDVMLLLNSSKTNQNTSRLRASIVVNDEAAATVSVTDVSCVLASGGTSCKVNLPAISAKSGYTAVGYNTSKSATTASVSSGGEVTLTKDTTYYVITKNNTPRKATFTIQDTSAVSNTSGDVTCDLFNGASSCQITAPTLSAKSGYTAIGWNTKGTAKTASLMSGAKVTISSNVTYKSITSKTVTITFAKGTDVSGFGNSPTKLASVYINSAGKTIVSNEGDSATATCTAYNGGGCRIVGAVPAVYSGGNMITGISANDGSGYIFVNDCEFSSNNTYYIKTGYFRRNGNATAVANVPITKQVLYGNMILEVSDEVDQTNAKSIEDAIKLVYDRYPALFLMNGKYLIMSHSKYVQVLNPIQGDMSGTNGLSMEQNEFDNVYLNDYAADYNYHIHAAIHEIGHQLDFLYRRTIGKRQTYLADKEDVIALYNKYRDTIELTDYSKLNVEEFIGEAFAETMREVINTELGTERIPAAGTLPSDVKAMILKYINEVRDFFVEEGRIQ